MPSLTDLRRRFPSAAETHERATASEEMLVSDARSQLTPMQVVDRKLSVELSREQQRRESIVRGPARSQS
jgi:hypothetical protein